MIASTSCGYVVAISMIVAAKILMIHIIIIAEIHVTHFEARSMIVQSMTWSIRIAIATIASNVTSIIGDMFYSNLAIAH